MELVKSVAQNTLETYHRQKRSVNYFGDPVIHRLGTIKTFIIIMKTFINESAY